MSERIGSSESLLCPLFSLLRVACGGMNLSAELGAKGENGI